VSPRLGAWRRALCALTLLTTVALAAPAACDDAEQVETPPSASDVAAEPIYGRPLMSQEEIDRYQEELAELSLEERPKFLREHRAKMDERARSLGLTSPSGVAEEGEIYGKELMTPQEIDAYRKRFHETTGSERTAFLREHRERMDARMRERDAQLPAVGSAPSEGHDPPH
jgi:hypothetical protein